MDCHHGMGAMKSCSLSCCHTVGQHLMAPNTFVLPCFALHLGPSLAEFHSVMSIPNGPFRADKPVTPPPRISIL